jgi:hypothetical protein
LFCISIVFSIFKVVLVTMPHLSGTAACIRNGNLIIVSWSLFAQIC